jgi:hypothetical protein
MFAFPTVTLRLEQYPGMMEKLKTPRHNDTFTCVHADTGKKVVLTTVDLRKQEFAYIHKTKKAAGQHFVLVDFKSNQCITAIVMVKKKVFRKQCYGFHAQDNAQLTKHSVTQSV